MHANGTPPFSHHGAYLCESYIYFLTAKCATVRNGVGLYGPGVCGDEPARGVFRPSFPLAHGQDLPAGMAAMRDREA